MPSVKLSLPRYVIARPRRDGSYSVMFIVPAHRKRPDGWPPTIPLPTTGRRRGNLDDPDEVGRIWADAARYNARLDEARAEAAGETQPFGSIPYIVARYQSSDRWALLRERTQHSYREKIRHIEAWSKTNNHPHVKTIRPRDVLTFLDVYNDRPSQKNHLRAMLSILMSEAVMLGLRDDNPCGAIRLRTRRPKKAVTLWTRADVRHYQETAIDLGWMGGAILVRAMWETGCRPTDAPLWRKGEHFLETPEGPVIEYETSKVGVYACAPISNDLANLIRNSGAMYLVTDRLGRVYQPVKDDNRLTADFRWLRGIAVRRGGRALQLRQLRHSAATDAIEHGMTASQTRALTTHTTDTILMQTYVQRTRAQARVVQKARGIIDD